MSYRARVPERNIAFNRLVILAATVVVVTQAPQAALQALLWIQWG